MNRRTKFGFFALTVLGLVMFQAAYFAGMVCWTPSSHPPHADLCVLLSGPPTDRFVNGFKMMQQDHPAPFFMVSSATAGRMQTFLRDFGPPDSAQILLEPNATTTVENALFTRRIALERGFKSVLVATSWYHVPRVYAIFTYYFAFSGVKFSVFAVDPRPTGWYTSKVFRQEFVKFWGSIGRICTGRLKDPDFQVK